MQHCSLGSKMDKYSRQKFNWRNLIIQENRQARLKKRGTTFPNNGKCICVCVQMVILGTRNQELGNCCSYLNFRHEDYMTRSLQCCSDLHPSC
jgi:hypothetical protein